MVVLPQFYYVIKGNNPKIASNLTYLQNILQGIL